MGWLSLRKRNVTEVFENKISSEKASLSKIDNEIELVRSQVDPIMDNLGDIDAFTSDISHNIAKLEALLVKFSAISKRLNEDVHSHDETTYAKVSSLFTEITELEAVATNWLEKDFGEIDQLNKKISALIKGVNVITGERKRIKRRAIEIAKKNKWLSNEILKIHAQVSSGRSGTIKDTLDRKGSQSRRTRSGKTGLATGAGLARDVR
jgi:chromosome segregation ATPase